MKVIGVGFHKTGTSSLAAALEYFGFRVKGTVAVYEEGITKEKVKRRVMPYLTEYDAFQDNPWFLLYEELDKWFNKAKFILTVRSEEEWMKSVLNHFGGNSTPGREMIYGFGDPRGNEEIYLKKYKKHNQNVRSYFDDRDNFLEVNLTKGERWKPICNFLNVSVPNIPFPHKNQKRY